ncbi:pyridoxamine 5'-phosphate oxidase family protein [Methanocella arvoryzae]|uniref:Predicted pyridoxamine 5'-phosphate oxidase family protein n=1 Tax=Methanocella arvoryzae (strain DSM 22066 / NBRC 105507 / MRE50) TaxID=351160 RepID=Q0W099_METAR|nr:pyridoxamine 5'-phosphate oxidase family protein [Methanocella arvoryzae]CAJ38194.1 predicted pyridoxamine 5'-phosphate oxidase family protein [Methanocella arvoryzae MRE50]
MDFKDCVKFANETNVCYLATIDNGQPRVRAMGLFLADETGIYLQTATMKDLYRQLKANPKVEMCFFKPGEQAGAMMRVEGEIEFVDDKKLKVKAIEDRPFLKAFGLTPDSPELIIFRLAKGQAYFWTMKDNLKPKEKISFG